MGLCTAKDEICSSPGMNVMIPMGGRGSSILRNPHKRCRMPVMDERVDQQSFLIDVSQSFLRRIKARLTLHGTVNPQRVLAAARKLFHRCRRFSSEGYRLPKPLINIVGRPMLLWLLDNLKFSTKDTLWIGIQRSLDTEFAVEARLRKEYPSLQMRLVFLDFQTRGAAETLFVMLQHMSPEELRRKSISLDCDTIYFSDVLGDFRVCGREYGCSFYFEDGGDKPIYSYILFEPDTKIIVDIREKVAISRHANTGAYAFPCGECLRNACRELLDNPVGKAGEFYTSTIIEGMITAGEKLSSFLELVRCGRVKPRHVARFCFDLDRTLLTTCSSGMGVHIEDTQVRPLHRNILLLQELKDAGHYVIVETSRERNNGPGGGGDDGALSGPGAVTLMLLRELGICYDEIVFGKPVADVYINNMAGNVHGNIEKEVGWRLEAWRNDDGVAGDEDNFVTPRPFNKITRLDESHIVKSGPLEHLRGELHFYRSIPPELSKLFPKLVEGNDNPSLTMPSMTITKIDGVSFSHLVTNHCVTRGRFMKLLHGLTAIHDAQQPAREPADGITAGTTVENTYLISGKDERELGIVPHCTATMAPSSEPISRTLSPEKSPEELPASILCANLHSKVASRLRLHSTSYDGFGGIDVRGMSQTILTYLRDYQEKGRCHQAAFVHGDPVFSNCLLTKESNVAFVDMRGSLGDMVCTKGDVNYDLSKVYQSLCGYDFIIMDKELDATAMDILHDLKENAFWPFVREHYPHSLARDIALLAASHFLSILPFHEDRRHQTRFLVACGDILAENDLLPRTTTVAGGGRCRLR